MAVPQVLIIGPSNGFGKELQEEIVSRYRVQNLIPDYPRQSIDGSEENVIFEGLQVKVAALQGEFQDLKELNTNQQAFSSPDVVVMCCPRKDEHGGDSLHTRLESWDRMISKCFTQSAPKILKITTMPDTRAPAGVDSSLDDRLIFRMESLWKIATTCVPGMTGRVTVEDLMYECVLFARTRKFRKMIAE